MTLPRLFVWTLGFAAVMALTLVSVEAARAGAAGKSSGQSSPQNS